jgi:hypothetical protein
MATSRTAKSQKLDRGHSIVVVWRKDTRGVEGLLSPFQSSGVGESGVDHMPILSRSRKTMCSLWAKPVVTWRRSSRSVLIHARLSLHLDQFGHYICISCKIIELRALNPQILRSDNHIQQD